MTKNAIRSKKKKISFARRLGAVSRRTWVVLGIVMIGLIGVRLTVLSSATAFEYIGTHPQAVKQPETSTGAPLYSLAAWNGKIYAGYGDYDKNTGPVSLTPFDPATNAFTSTPEHVADTEQIDLMQVINNKLYALHVDPKSHNGAAYSIGDMSSGKTTWLNHAQPTMTHVFGITSGNSPSELFISGQLDEGSATNEVAKVYRSTDGGATWSESLSVPSRGGFNRMMFIGKLGDKIYAQNLSTADFNGKQPETKAWVFSGNSWAKATPLNSYQPYKGAEFAGKLLAQSSPAGGSLLGYDGRSSTTVRSNIRDYKIHSDGYLYALTYYENTLSVMRTTDLVTWENISAAPKDARSLAILNNAIYIGTTNSELYKATIDPSITDKTPPSATLIAPVAPYTVTTSNEFAVSASDPASINKVEFYAGSTLIGVSSYKAKATETGCFSIGSSSSCYTTTSNYAGNYTIKWNGSGVAAGTYSLKAVAYDIYGNARETASVDITVPAGLYPPDTEAPVVRITNPTTSTRVRKSVSIYAQASDNKAVVHMEAELDGNLVATSSSGSLSKNIALPRGSHTLIVTAKDAAGNSSQSSVTFTSR